MLAERIRSGIEAKRKNSPDGKWRKDRRHALDAAGVKEARIKLASGEYTRAQVAKDLGVSRVTLWRALTEAELMEAARP